MRDERQMTDSCVYLADCYEDLFFGNVNKRYRSMTAAQLKSRMERLNRYQQQKGCENLLLTPAKTQGAGILNLAHTGQAYTVFMELLPVFHVFSALGSEALGINCDLPKFDDFYGVMDTKL